MEQSISERLANIILNITTPVLFNGGLNVASPPSRTVDRVLFGQRISNIVVAGPDLRLIFKIHYTHEIGNLLLGNAGSVANEGVIDDYFKESCNIAAGRLKSRFEGQGTLLGISIPIKTKAFDELFYSVQSGGEYITEWHWDLSRDDISVHVSVFVELLNPEFKISSSLEEVKVDEELEFF